MKLLPTRISAETLAPIVRVFVALGITPNMITVAGLIGSIAAGVAIANEQLILGGILVLVFGGLDMFDGAVARATGRATPFGALFDSVLDRMGEAVVLGGILIYELDRGNKEEAILAFAAVVGSILVSYVRARAEGLGLTMTSGLFTRPERIVVTGAALILGLLRPALWILAIVTLLTVVQRIDAGRRLLNEQASAQGDD
jgi:CDP-diacylglycerol--glycerol-3-phosphate 3-phosphatidyltransferase